MNFENAKAKAKEIWEKVTVEDEEEEIVEEEPKKENPLDMRMKMIRFVLGFVGVAILLQAIMPEMLTKIIFTIPNGEITFMSMLPICVLFITVYTTSDIFGKQIIVWTMRIGNNIKNRVTIPKMIGDVMVPIIIGGYLIYKLYYPNIMALLTGVR